MARSLIDGVYDLYLQRSGKGQLYEVPIHIKQDDRLEEIPITVWAKNEREAEERALAQAQNLEHRGKESIEQRSMGLVLPRSHYKPKSTFKAATSPFAVWRDPVYKKGLSNVFRPMGYRFGTMTRLSIRDLKQQMQTAPTDAEPTKGYLTKALKVNIVSLFIWVGLSIIGLVFLLLGFHPGNAGRFVLDWLNPYIAAGIMCLFVGGVAVFKTCRDYRWIVHKLETITHSETHAKNEEEATDNG